MKFSDQLVLSVATAVKQQFSALCAETYDLTCVPRVLPARRAVCEHRVSAEQIMTGVVNLMHMNRQGFDIFVTPHHSLFFYILVDDIRDFDMFVEWGPVLALRTSTASRQGVLKLPGTESERAAAGRVAGILNKTNGDPGVANPSQAMRLAGFVNRKPTRKNETVEILLSDPSRAPGRAIKRLFELSKTRVQRSQFRKSPVVFPRMSSLQKRADDLFDVFNELWNKESETCSDNSVIDYHVICDMFRAGYSPADLVTVLELSASRKSDPRKYAERTVFNVVSRCQMRRG